MSQTIRIPDSLYALAQREAELMSRTVAQQLEHWARLGLALEGSGVTSAQVRHLLDMEMGRRLDLPSSSRPAPPAAAPRREEPAYEVEEDDDEDSGPLRDEAPALDNTAVAESDDDYSDEEIAVAITCISGVMSLEEGADEADISERELRRLMAGLLRRHRHMSLAELEALSADRRLQLATEIAFAEHAARARAR